MKVVATNEAKTHLSALLQEVERGETIVITRGRKPLAKLIAYDEPKARPMVGEMMDEPYSVPDSALRPMKTRELQAWGI